MSYTVPIVAKVPKSQSKCKDFNINQYDIDNLNTSHQTLHLFY